MSSGGWWLGWRRRLGGCGSDGSKSSKGSGELGPRGSGFLSSSGSGGLWSWSLWAIPREPKAERLSLLVCHWKGMLLNGSVEREGDVFIGF